VTIQRKARVRGAGTGRSIEAREAGQRRAFKGADGLMHSKGAAHAVESGCFARIGTTRNNNVNAVNE